MTWTRADLSRRLLEAGGKACEQFDAQVDPHAHYCSNCGLSLQRHLMKHAAEEIGVLEARTPTWHPITTAPKDGTWILLRGESGYANRPYRAHVGRWISGEGRDGGWWEESEDAYFTDDGDPPTHWMPLPDPPVKETP